MSNTFGESAPVTEGLLESFHYGRGFFELLDGPDPVAGAEFSVTNPGAFISRLVTAAFLFTASAQAANRVVNIEYQDGNGKVFYRAGSAQIVTANAAIEFTACVGGPQPVPVVGTPTQFSLPNVFLEPGRVIVIDVDAIDAADAITAVVLGWERFPTGPRGFPEGRVGAGARRPEHSRAAHHLRRP